MPLIYQPTGTAILRWVVMPATATPTATTTCTMWYGDNTATATTSGFWEQRGYTPWQEAETLDRLIDATVLPTNIVRLPRPAAPAIIREREAIATQRRQDQENALRELEVRQARANEAQTRARELLLEHLTPEQRDTFVNRGWFVVEGKRQRYRIETHRGYTGNIVRLADASNGRHEQRYCAHCDPGVAPGHDQFLAQKFMLEHAEDDFLRIANRH